MENASYEGILGNDAELGGEATSDSTILEAIFQRAETIAASKQDHRPSRQIEDQETRVTHALLMNLPWKVKPSSRRILDEWAIPMVVRTEVVVAVDKRGSEYELPALPEELRHYLVDTHNERLRHEIERAIERAKPKEYHKLQSLDDLQSVIAEQKAKEGREAELDKTAGRNRPPLQKAGTRLDPVFSQAFKQLAAKANVTEGFLQRAGLEDYFRNVIEQEIDAIKNEGVDLVGTDGR